MKNNDSLLFKGLNYSCRKALHLKKAHYLFYLLICFLFVLNTSFVTGGKSGGRSLAVQNAAKLRDGQHDFDFKVGNWKTKITRLLHPLSGSKASIKLEGTVTVRKVWGGKAAIEEIEADGPNGHWEGLTLFMYNPQSHQWSQTFANSNDGTLDTPAIGEFKDGRGELYNTETFKGRSVLVRALWSKITPDTHQFEQAFSTDGGKTWETNFFATLERIK